MDEKQVNCVIGACCCEADCSEKKRKALAQILHAGLGHGPYAAEQIADFLLSHFDFAPKGTLTPLMETVAKLIKAGPYQG